MSACGTQRRSQLDTHDPPLLVYNDLLYETYSATSVATCSRVIILKCHPRLDRPEGMLDGTVPTFIRLIRPIVHRTRADRSGDAVLATQAFEDDANFSSAEKCRLVALRMSRTVSTALRSRFCRVVSSCPSLGATISRKPSLSQSAQSVRLDLTASVSPSSIGPRQQA